MNIINCNKFDIKKITLHKTSSNNDIYLFPLKYNNNKLIFKTPSLIIPYGIRKSNFDKEYITFSFPNIFQKTHVTFYRVLLKIEKWCEDNLNCLIRYINKTKKIQSKEKYEKLYKKNIHYKKIIDISKYDPTIQMKLSDKVEFFDNDSNPISKQDIQPKTNCKVLFYISGIWFNQNTKTFGICLHCHLLKLISIKQRCLVFDNDEDEHHIKIDCKKLTKEKTSQICCPNCDETIIISLLNYIDLQNKTKNVVSLPTNIDPRYEKFIKMKKFGVPLMAIKQKIISNKLDYTQFIQYLNHNNSSRLPKLLNNTNKNNYSTTENTNRKKMFNFSDLLKQKRKLKKTNIKKKSVPKKKWYMKGKSAPSLQDILKTLHSLKSVKKNLSLK